MGYWERREWDRWLLLICHTSKSLTIYYHMMSFWAALSLLELHIKSTLCISVRTTTIETCQDTTVNTPHPYLALTITLHTFCMLAVYSHVTHQRPAFSFTSSYHTTRIHNIRHHTTPHSLSTLTSTIHPHITLTMSFLRSVLQIASRILWSSSEIGLVVYSWKILQETRGLQISPGAHLGAM